MKFYFQVSKSQTYILMETQKTRTVIEMNRNWCLLAAQLSFLGLTERHEAVPEPVCRIFGGITHFAYLTFFSWTRKCSFWLWQEPKERQCRACVCLAF